MIKISLDEAYVYDILSIYAVKIENSEGEKRQKSLDSFNKLSEEIQNQIGMVKHHSIINSSAYFDLKHANKEVFDLVDRAGETYLSKLTADANYKRYIKKVELQTKFFDNQITEVKI
jgi:hypothetical protein